MDEQTIPEQQGAHRDQMRTVQDGSPIIVSWTGAANAVAHQRSLRSGAFSGMRIGPYQLCEVVGAGGMAEVYRAKDLNLEREVAVKVLAAQMADDAEYVNRFRAEARRVGALSHPHLVPVYDAGETDMQGIHLLYLVMPLLRESLRDLRRRERKLPAAEAVWLVLRIAEGLEAAHRRGIVHRDIKPGNVLLDAEGHPLLADFGIARELSASPRGVPPTQSGLVVGTPEYMAPEQLRGAHVDQRADVYALGAVLYELLTGQLPFIGATPYDLAAKVLNAPLLSPTLLEPTIPPGVEQVVLAALARDPAERYADAGMFAAALRAATAVQLDTPRFPSVSDRSLPMSRWHDSGHSLDAFLPRGTWSGAWAVQRRHGLRLFLLAAALLVLFAGSGVLFATHQHGTEPMMVSRGLSEPPHATPTIHATATPSATTGQAPVTTVPPSDSPPTRAAHGASAASKAKPAAKAGNTAGNKAGAKSRPGHRHPKNH